MCISAGDAHPGHHQCAVCMIYLSINILSYSIFIKIIFNRYISVLETLFLDTTYCDPAHDFPPQADAVR